MWLWKDGYSRRRRRRHHHLIQNRQALYDEDLSIRTVVAGERGGFLRYDPITSVHQMEVKCQQFSL